MHMIFALMTTISLALIPGTSKALVKDWSFSLNGHWFGGISFSGSDLNSDGWIKSSDGEITKLTGHYSNGNFGSPSFAGTSWKDSGSVSFFADGIFGNQTGEFVFFSSTYHGLCSIEVCGADPTTGNPREVTIYDHLVFDGNTVSSGSYIDWWPRFHLSDEIGPQIVNGPVSLLPTPLPAPLGMLAGAILAFGALRKWGSACR